MFPTTMVQSQMVVKNGDESHVQLNTLKQKSPTKKTKSTNHLVTKSHYYPLLSGVIWEMKFPGDFQHFNLPNS